MDLEPQLDPRPFAAAPDEVEALLGALHRNRLTFALEAVARSERAVDAVLADGGLDHQVALGDGPERFILRRVLVDLVEEYARHTGHAGLLRESVDGLTGEDAPQ